MRSKQDGGGVQVVPGMTDIAALLDRSLLFGYAAVFVGGVLTSFTPCVYPIIPLTAGYIGAASPGRSRMRSLILSLAYVFGLAMVYAILGMIAALTGSLFGEIASSPWTYLLVGNIVLLFALSMLDVFYIPMPAYLSRLAGKTPKGEGLLPAMGMGAVSGLVVGPCTAPVLGAVLAYTASQQNLLLGFSLLFTFALGMGTLLVVIGTFTGLIASLPRSGAWLHAVKKVFGGVMILVAEYFLVQAGQYFV